MCKQKHSYEVNYFQLHDIDDYISDIDECDATPQPCSSDAQCTNTPGAYSCSCNSGFSGDGVTCSGIYNTLCHANNYS